MRISGYNGSYVPEIYSKEISEALLKTDFKVLDKITIEILKSKELNRRIFTAGNGGSSSTASHMINDLVKGCRIYGREGFSAICLNDSTALITCLANDFSYEEIFSIMLRTYAQPGDLLIVFSGSGNSPNILLACKTAKEIGMTIISFGGRDGGKMKDLSDYILLASTYSMEQIEDIHIIYVHALISSIREKLKYTWDMEIINYPKTINPKHAIFDFDGTISLIREGWQSIMYEYFVEELLQCPNAPSKEEIEKIVFDFVDFLTGKQTIFQCIRLSEEISKFGGISKSPLEYKAEYLRRLEVHIKGRKKNLKRGIKPSSFLVPGSVELLEKLTQSGISCYLTSGTDEIDVIQEASLLGISHYFKSIHGAVDEDSTFCSKEQVLNDLINNNSLNGSDLILFGDGFVEIELGKSIDSYTIALATNEEKKDTSINEWKRNRLLKAGADCIIPDFKNVERIFNFIWRC